MTKIMSSKNIAIAIFNSLIVLAIIVAACAMLPAKAQAAEITKWNKWGVAPYANSFDEACRKAPVAIDGFKSMPLEVREHFKKMLEPSCQTRDYVWLTPDMILEDMWSGGGKKKDHLIGPAAVEVLPVIQSLEGVKYRAGSVAQTAKALQWKYAYKGKTYVLYLPFVCFNWAWGFADEPLLEKGVAIRLSCTTVRFTVAKGDEVRFATLARKLLPASACWQLCDGDVCSAPPSPCDTCDWMGPKSVIPTGFEPLHTGRYIAKAEKQSLRFPIEVMSEYIALCVSREGVGYSDSWVVQPSAWLGTSVVDVPYGGQEWPSWGNFDKSKWQ